VSRPIDQIDSSHTNTPQLEHDGQPSSGRVLPSTLTVSQRGSVTLLRLSRPAKRNAFDEATIAGLETFFSDLPEVMRVVVLFGEGEHFSAGADLCSFADTSDWDRVLLSETWHRAFDRIENGGVPVIAALHGAVIGGGLELHANTSRPSTRARAHARGHQLGEHMDRHARAAKHRIPAPDLAYQPILGRRSGRAD
jgi:Enoyl-CoA hydratase/isomerase